MDQSPTSDQLLPSIAITDRQRLDQEREREALDAASPIQVMGAAVETEQLSSRVYKAGIDAFQGASYDILMDDLGLKQYAPDANFKGFKDITDDDRQAIFGDLSADELEIFEDEFEEAVSLEHAKAIRKKIDGVKKTKGLMDAQGAVEGFTYAALANISDPPTILATEATAGLAAPFIYTNKATRLTRALKLALLGAGTNMSVEALLAENDPYRNYTDILGAGLFGAAFGGGSGYLSKSTAGAGFDDLSLNEVHRSSVKDADVGSILADKVRTRYLPTDVVDDIGVVDISAADVEKSLDKIGASMGAAKIAKVDDILTKGDEELLQVAESLRMSPEDVRGDLLSETAYLARSENPVAGFMAAQLNVNPTSGLIKGKAQPLTLVEDKDRFFKIENASFNVSLKQAMGDYMKATKTSGLVGRIKAAPEFFNKVGEAVLRGPTSEHMSDPAIAKAVRQIDQQNRKILAAAKRAGIEGLEEVEEKLYMKRAWSHDKINTLEYKYGSDSVIRFVAGGLKTADGALDDAMAFKIAKGVLGTIKRAKYGVDTGKASVFSHDNEEMLRKFAKEVMGDDVDEEALDYVVSEIRGRTPSTYSRAKRRTNLDDAYEAEIEVGNTKSPDWGKLERVKMTDLFETNAMRLQTDYIREMSGAIALARKGFTNPTKIQSFLTSHKRIGGKLADDPNIPGYTHDRLKDEKVKMEALFKGILGRPMFDSDTVSGRFLTKASPYLRAVKDWNYMRLMNNGGFNMGGEILSAMVQGGIKETLQQIPEFRNILKRAKSGELTNELAREMEYFTGIGTEHMLFDPYNRLDDLGNNAQDATVMGRNITPALGFGTQVTSMISGMTPLTMFADRGLSMVFIQKLANKADEFSKSGKDINKWWGTKRMESLGLDPAMRQRIYDQMLAHGKFTESWVTGRKVKATNFNDWDDKEAAEALSLATFRFVNRAVQKNSLGDMRLIFSNELAGLATQFMGYGLSSMNKQLAYGVKMRDYAAWAGFTASTLGAALFYTLRTHVLSLGRENREEYLEKRLSTKAITAGAIYYSTYAGVLPNVIDTGLAFTGNDEFFSNARSSNMVANVILGNPSVDLVTQMLRTGKTAGTLPKDMLTGEPALTQQDWAAFKSILPYQNFAPINAGANAIKGYLPSRYEE